MTDEQIVYLEALAALAVALGSLAHVPERSWFRRPEVVVSAALLVVGGAIRWLVVQPTFIHADMLGSGFVDAYLAFPSPSTFRVTYGQFGFFAVGAITRLFGRDTGSVFHAMQAVGLVNVALLGVLAARLARSSWAGVFAVSLAITSPVLMRVAASEDMHNFALVPGLLALVCMDHHATTKKPASLVAAVLALGLMAHSRQTFYLFAPSAFLLALARGGAVFLRRPSFWLAGIAVLAVLVPRAMATASVEGDALPKILMVLTSRYIAPLVFANHPLFDVARFGIFPLVTIAALAWSTVAGAVPRALFVAFVLSFVATYTCGFPSPGVEFAQRLPAFALGLVLAACFLARMLELRVPEAFRARVALAGAMVLVVAPFAFRGVSVLRERTTDYREFEAIEARVERLPRSFTLVILPSPAILQGYSRYAGMFRRHGKRVRVVRTDEHVAATPGPRLFLEGVECWTYTFRDLMGARAEAPDPRRSAVRFERTLFGRERFPVARPSRMRDECAAVLAGSRPLGPTLRLDAPIDDPPFLFYAASPVPVRFHEVAGPP